MQFGMTRGSSSVASSLLSSPAVMKPALMVCAPLSRTNVREGRGGGAGLDFRGAMWGGGFFLFCLFRFSWDGGNFCLLCDLRGTIIFRIVGPVERLSGVQKLMRLPALRYSGQLPALVALRLKIAHPSSLGSWGYSGRVGYPTSTSVPLSPHMPSLHVIQSSV